MSIAQPVRQRVRQTAQNRCGYCLSQQQYVMGLLEIEHIIPQAKGGTDDEGNLWLACRLCNSYKATQTYVLDSVSDNLVPLFNPRQQIWAEHFRWNPEGDKIEGISPCGRATVIALNLNNPIAVMVRQAWIRAGWHPPK